MASTVLCSSPHPQYHALDVPAQAATPRAPRLGLLLLLGMGALLCAAGGFYRTAPASGSLTVRLPEARLTVRKTVGPEVTQKAVAGVLAGLAVLTPSATAVDATYPSATESAPQTLSAAAPVAPAVQAPDVVARPAPVPANVDPVGLGGRVGLLVVLGLFSYVSFYVLSDAFAESEVERANKLERRRMKRAKSAAEAREAARAAAGSGADLEAGSRDINPAPAPLVEVDPAVIDAAVEKFYSRLESNAQLKTCFELGGADLKGQRRENKKALARLVETRFTSNARIIRDRAGSDFFFYFLGLGIAGKLFDTLVAELVTVMREYKVEEKDIAEAQALAKALHKDVYG